MSFNRAFREIEGETFRGEITESNFQGTVFRNCEFINTKFIRSRFDRTRFFACQGAEDIEFGKGCRVDGALLEGEPWTPDKTHASVRKGKPLDSGALTEVMNSMESIGYEEENPSLPVSVVEEKTRIDALKLFANETKNVTDAAWSPKVIDHGG